MTDKQIFENEIKCIIRRNDGVCNGGSDCIKCDLLMDSEEILKCYNRAIQNIDLIDRQKEEFEILNIENETMTTQLRNAYEQIHKGKAEVERLTETLDGETTENMRHKHEIERLKNENERLKMDLAKCSIRLDNLYETADEIKSEAYKECLARVRNYIKTHCNAYGKPDFDYDTSIKILKFIDDLQKQRREDEGK